MERKRIEKLVVLLLIGILLPVSLFPFRINADTLSTSNITYNYYLSDVVDSTSQLANKDYIYDVDFIFDKSYLGWVSVSMITSYIFATGDTRQATYTKAIYVNGNTAKTSIVISSNFTGANGSPLSSMSITINNSNVTPLADLSSLQDIIDLLQEIDDHISIDVMQELENIVSNTSLANDYLEIISKLRNYNIPFESFPYIALCSRKYDVFNYMSDEYFYYSLPLFKATRTNTNGELFNYYVSKSKSEYINVYYLISYRTSTGASPSLATTSTSSLIQNTEVQFFTFPNGYGGYLSLMKRKYYLNNSGYFVLYTNSTSDFLFCPLYIEYDGVISNVSTDFALRLGLSNQLMYDLNIIANGTSQSSSSSGSLDQATSQFSDDANDLVTIEESFNNSMNSSLQNVDPSFNMGSSFLTSANWVSQQFNRIVNNTPFASLITFGLTLGLGLLIIGKVRK